MSDSNDAASRTEEPTPHKLEQARERGDVAKTADLPPLAALVAAASVLIGGGSYFAQHLATGLTPFLAHPDAMVLDGQGGAAILHQVLLTAGPMVLTVLLSAGVAGAAGNFVQHGLIFAPGKLKPDFNRVSPMAGLKRIFGPDGLVQFAKSVSKLVLVAVVAWWALKPRLAALQNLSMLEPAGMLPLCVDILRSLVFATAGVLLAITGLDWFWQRQRFMTRMRMSKEELKEDFKQSEGDPHVRARQKQIRNERARRRMMQAVPTATVVVMNPTHYAVALKYDAETPAPVCVAKGLDSLALKIRETAEAAGVPVIEDPPLARSLYAAVDLDESIPPKHYEAVAKVIGFILNAGRRAAARPL